MPMREMIRRHCILQQEGKQFIYLFLFEGQPLPGFSSLLINSIQILTAHDGNGGNCP